MWVCACFVLNGVGIVQECTTPKLGVLTHASHLGIIDTAYISHHTFECGVPGAAGVSGVVEPLEQLGVRGHAHFDQVGVWLHAEGPEVTVKQGRRLSTKPITANISTLKHLICGELS